MEICEGRESAVYFLCSFQYWTEYATDNITGVQGLLTLKQNRINLNKRKNGDSVVVILVTFIW